MKLPSAAEVASTAGRKATHVVFVIDADLIVPGGGAEGILGIGHPGARDRADEGTGVASDQLGEDPGDLSTLENPEALEEIQRAS